MDGQNSSRSYLSIKYVRWNKTQNLQTAPLPVKRYPHDTRVEYDHIGQDEDRCRITYTKKNGSKKTAEDAERGKTDRIMP